MKLLALLFVSALVGCASPFPTVGSASEAGDALYKVEDHPRGFTISTTFRRYQLRQEREAVQLACKQGLLASAKDLAKAMGRKIEAIDEQRLRISMSRNDGTGITTCQASVPVVWAR